MAISLSNELLNEPAEKVSELLEENNNEDSNNKDIDSKNIGMKY